MSTLDRIAAKVPGGMPALSRALSRAQVEHLEKTLQALATDQASEETLAPALARAMAIMAKAGAGDTTTPTAAAIPAEALLGASLTTSRASSSAQIQAALRAYRMVAGL
jgi:hypothetical protein